MEARRAWRDAGTMGGATTRAAIMKMPVCDARGLIQPENASVPAEMVTSSRKAGDSVACALRAASPVRAHPQSAPVVTLSYFVKVHHMSSVVNQ